MIRSIKSSSAEKPLYVEISIEVLSEPGITIHQLAAKKAVVELEDGHGWLLHTKDGNGVLVKDKILYLIPINGRGRSCAPSHPVSVHYRSTRRFGLPKGAKTRSP